MKNKKIWVVTVGAKSPRNSTAMPVFVYCESKEEAIGKGMIFAKEKWKESNGWSGYISEAMELPDQVIHWIIEQSKADHA